MQQLSLEASRGLTWVAKRCRFLAVCSSSSGLVVLLRVASILLSAPLAYRRMVPSGLRAMTLMRPRSLLNSIMLSTSKVASWPSMRSVTPCMVRLRNSKPSWRPPSTSATSSGDGPCLHAGVTMVNYSACWLAELLADAHDIASDIQARVTLLMPTKA